MSVVAVTGASGLVGRHLCRDLLRRGHDVRALVRAPASMAAEPAGLDVRGGDLPDGLDAGSLEGAEVVVHCAWATREADPHRARRVDEEGTRTVLEASRRAGVGRFVFVSSVSAAPDAPSRYGRTKHAMEALLDPERDLVLRPGLVLAAEGQGLFQRMRDSVASTGVVPLFSGGHQPLQTVHVDDLCEAVARALDRGIVGTLAVAEPEPVELGAFLRRVAELLGVRCRFVPVPYGLTLAAVRAAEALRLPLPIGAESVRGVRALRAVPTAADLARLDLTVRPAEESLRQILVGDGSAPAP